MNTTHKEILAQTIESALTDLGIQSAQTGDGKWSANLDQVEVQIAIEGQPEKPSLLLYFVVLQLPQQHRAACIEELMRANFHNSSKYAVFDEFILQMVDLQQAQSLGKDHFKELLQVYAHHVSLLRENLYVRYFQ